MKLVIAQMKHETNTYSPVPTPLARFATGTRVPPEGEAYRRLPGTGAALAAFIDLAEQAGAQIDAAHRRQRLAERAGGGRRLRAHRRPHLRRRGAGLRRRAAGPARRDGDAEPRGRRGRAAAPHPRHRARGAHRRRAGHAHQPLRRDGRERHRDRRLPDLPARRHVRDRAARRPRRASRCSPARPGRRWPGATSRCCRT
jgi:hypothetical protein